MERDISSTVLDDSVDFVKLSEALGAKAIRVTRMEDVEPALKMALAAEGPVVLDCWIDQDLSVFPMVPAGANLDDVFDEEDMKKHEQSVQFFCRTGSASGGVLKEVADEMLDYNGTGMSVME